eukprot:CAMPEP_0197075816 /NCGR_PEP_ID=MMETSP1384-20130603/211798_1 /TAXON_ID=29189 /ORGANISM="Ammonia sp." /LENGTH=617 /DNA_ID=CAMNT_0042514665 /DNA_START=73 /DNA_END=1927 /DNA_ORIENTATION=-
MDWLLKHNLIRQYLQTNFTLKEYKKAVKYTLIVGIQTLYQLHGNSSTDPRVSFSLEQLAAMIVSNNGTLQVQSDLPALNKCLKDIKAQLGDIQTGLDDRRTPPSTSAATRSKTNTQKFVNNLVSHRASSNSTKTKHSHKNPKRKQMKSKAKSANNSKRKRAKQQMVKKADSKWRVGDSQQFKQNADQIYPKWWPKDDDSRYYRGADSNHSFHVDAKQEHDEEAEPQSQDDEEEEHDAESRNYDNYEEDTPHPPHVAHPQIYEQPIAFSIPKTQFAEQAGKDNIVQLHVNLYPEYMQKCVDANMNHAHHRNKAGHAKQRKNSSQRAKSLTRCTESSQAKAVGNRAQSAFLKSDRRNIAPCLKYNIPAKETKTKRVSEPTRGADSKANERKSEIIGGVKYNIPAKETNTKRVSEPTMRSRQQSKRKKVGNNRRRSLPNKPANNASNGGPKYLQNVESRIRNDLNKDRMRNRSIQREKKLFLRDIARFGLQDDDEQSGENDEYVQDWKEQFKYDRLSRDEIARPSAVSVADAMMKSDVIQAIDPSFNKKPMLVNANRVDFEAERMDTLYETVMNSKHHDHGDEATISMPNDSLNMDFLSDLREWAAGLNAKDLTADTDLS